MPTALDPMPVALDLTIQVSTLTDEITEKIKTDPVYSQTFIRRILEDALNNL